jgi:hypothetical protein
MFKVWREFLHHPAITAARHSGCLYNAHYEYTGTGMTRLPDRILSHEDLSSHLDTRPSLHVCNAV